MFFSWFLTQCRQASTLRLTQKWSKPLPWPLTSNLTMDMVREKLLHYIMIMRGPVLLITSVCIYCKAVRPVSALTQTPAHLSRALGKWSASDSSSSLSLSSPLFPSLHPLVSDFLYFPTVRMWIISEGVIIVGVPQTIMFSFSLKDRIMRQSIYLHSVMCVSPDTVKRHVDLSVSALVTGGVGVASYTAGFFNVSFFFFSPFPHSFSLHSHRIHF